MSATAIALPRRMVWLRPAEGLSTGVLDGATPRDCRLIRELARVRPVVWGDLLRGAIDARYAIRVQARFGRNIGVRKLVLAVAEVPDREHVDVFPLDAGDRALLADLFPEETAAGSLPTPSRLVSRAIKNRVELTIRSDLRVIR